MGGNSEPIANVLTDRDDRGASLEQALRSRSRPWRAATRAPPRTSTPPASRPPSSTAPVPVAPSSACVARPTASACSAPEPVDRTVEAHRTRPAARLFPPSLSPLAVAGCGGCERTARRHRRRHDGSATDRGQPRPLPVRRCRGCTHRRQHGPRDQAVVAAEAGTHRPTTTSSTWSAAAAKRRRRAPRRGEVRRCPLRQRQGVRLLLEPGRRDAALRHLRVHHRGVLQWPEGMRVGGRRGGDDPPGVRLRRVGRGPSRPANSTLVFVIDPVKVG